MIPVASCCIILHQSSVKILEGQWPLTMVTCWFTSACKGPKLKDSGADGEAAQRVVVQGDCGFAMVC